MTVAFPGAHPHTRPRRNRRDAWTRSLVAENRVTPADLIWPVFILDSDDQVEEIPSLPGVQRLGRKPLQEAAKRAVSLGIPAMALFPVVPAELKNEDADEAKNPDNLMCRG
ncbi:MAG: porphobilinogen synthase, partial [Myxococcota bacterium]